MIKKFLSATVLFLFVVLSQNVFAAQGHEGPVGDVFTGMTQGPVGSVFTG
ncbi:hypothetical protein [Legionella geestiana]|nr:hypothetical protein [Legionella geestiana]STX54227.1 Uncharacterised protein [Legionella geestiana]